MYVCMYVCMVLLSVYALLCCLRHRARCARGGVWPEPSWQQTVCEGGLKTYKIRSLFLCKDGYDTERERSEDRVAKGDHYGVAMIGPRDERRETREREDRRGETQEGGPIGELEAKKFWKKLLLCSVQCYLAGGLIRVAIWSEIWSNTE